MRLRSMGPAESYREESRAAQSQLANSLATKRSVNPGAKSRGKGNIASAANNATYNYILGVPIGTTAAAKLGSSIALEHITEAVVGRATISDALTYNYVDDPSVTYRILDSFNEQDRIIYNYLNSRLSSAEGNPNDVVSGNPWVHFRGGALDILIPSSKVSKSSTAAEAAANGMNSSYLSNAPSSSSTTATGNNNMSLPSENPKAAAAASSGHSSTSFQGLFLGQHHPTASTAAEAAAMNEGGGQKGGSRYVDPYAIIQLDFPTELAFLHLLAYRRVYLEKMNLETISTEQYINTPGILTMALEHAGYHEDPRFANLLARDHIVPRLRNNRTLKIKHPTRRQARHSSHNVSGVPHRGHSTARRPRRPHTGRSTARRPHKHHSTARHTLKHSPLSSLRV